ncbi:hypothetical protein PHG31p103 [Aeromonas phage 31]|uniref:Lipoprotein n=4 Tax=Biquartavirus TaxID=1912143 RepID=Q6U9J7_9CAUD|nr:hypothetical protein ST44RRORF105c [Aeromonas phage 44RR2.8t]YP_238832.1 hypothetical protein PHG31p103 [Aeromonas phage 31]APU00576.1 hypothetical protein [Aeromonas phage 44RR2.8t.2]APU00996.1 hypothetical protein [Aeromonas phage 31.2]APU01908.1 hypothetical protein [Aeromonas phage L9-6]APU02405.1 hypothetical protein [Aeromonas phage SW69-9]UYD59657.1 hypothetical protein JNMOADIG_00128 [Aeromonas phage avDM5]UYD60369.1 hypothetical protein NPHMPGLK_00034 [Aeromonas phage avDM2]
MKKSIATLIAIGMYGCSAVAPVTANVNEMFHFPQKSGVIQEFTDENGTYESALSASCDREVREQYDNCLGIVFNSDYWLIDGARDDKNILVGTERVMISLNGIVQNVDYIRSGSAIVIRRMDNPTFNPIGDVLSITTSSGKGEFTL